MSNDPIPRQTMVEVVEVVALIPRTSGRPRRETSPQMTARLASLARDYPLALVLAAGALGLVASRLLSGRISGDGPGTQRRRRPFADSLREGLHAERINGSLKAHGDAMRAAAGDTLAPTYPEG